MPVRTFSQSQYKNRFIALVKHPFFWFLTVAGNSIILLGSLLIYIFENQSGRSSLEFIDCVLWSTGLVTTIGYGDFTPQTLFGKFTVLFLMMSGTLFVWSYMGFVVTGLITPELTTLEKDVHDVEKELKDLRKN